LSLVVYGGMGGNSFEVTAMPVIKVTLEGGAGDKLSNGLFAIHDTGLRDCGGHRIVGFKIFKNSGCSRNAANKGSIRRRRWCVPLWWDGGTLADLQAWKARRVGDGARGDDAFVCSVQRHRRGLRLQRAAVRRRFLSGCKVLGLARLRTLTIHHGRHTYISHALFGGRSLAEVRVAAGHSSLLTTSVYLHVAVDDDGEVGSLFAFGR
jgi:integrase